MINLIYEKGEFRFEKAFESVTPQTMDVFLTVKDVVPDTQQPDLTQQACLFINKKLGTEYSTEGLGDFSKTEEKTIVSIDYCYDLICSETLWRTQYLLHSENLL